MITGGMVSNALSMCGRVCVVFVQRWTRREGLDGKEWKNQVDPSCLDMEKIVVVSFYPFLHRTFFLFFWDF